MIKNYIALEDKTTYDYRRKKHVQMKPKQGFLAAENLCILFIS